MAEKESHYSLEASEKRFEEYGRWSASENMAWVAISLTTFVLIMTVFSSFPPEKAGPNFGFFVDLSSALVLASGVLFGGSWFLFALAHYPRNVKLKVANPRETLSNKADLLTTAGSLFYSFGIVSILFALGMIISLAVFIVVFYPALFLFTYIQFFWIERPGESSTSQNTQTSSVSTESRRKRSSAGPNGHQNAGRREFENRQGGKRWE